MRALTPLFLCVVSLSFFSLNSAAQSSYDLKSPDGRIEVRVRTAGEIRYDVI